ncbi:hypothetical protein [Vallitalea sp.]|nr:hypothetical protein [Vallitalea sp.]MCT4688714.1 hypothetical protein [Vallitalea sp.]
MFSKLDVKKKISKRLSEKEKKEYEKFKREFDRCFNEKKIMVQHRLP